MSGNMTELASAYITLIPQMKGAKAQIEKQLGMAGIDKVAEKAGTSWGSTFGKSAVKGLTVAQSGISSMGSGFTALGKGFSRVGTNLTRYITAPAIAAGTAMAGVVAFKGFTRLRDIDTAKAKLGALGHSADVVKKIMANATSAVLGTSYALNEAATTAAGAVAAGVKPGKKLTAYLTNVADAAAIANVPMEEMGSIFNRTQTAGRAYAMELNMLADRGIPIYQWIAKEAGISAGAVRKMAVEGEVSSKLYFKAIKNNIGGAAKEMGETSFVGTAKNIGASIARIGENFLDAGGQGGGFFSQVKPLLVDLKSWLGGIEIKAKDFGVVFGEAFKVGVPKVKELIAVFMPLNTQTLSLADQTELWKNRVMSAFDWMINKATQLKGWYDGLSESWKKFVQITPLIAVAAGPTMKVVGPILTLTGGMLQATAAAIGLVKALTVAKTAAAATAAATAGAGASTGLLAGAFAALVSPVGLAVAATVAVIGSAYLVSAAMKRNKYLADDLAAANERLDWSNKAVAQSKNNAASASRNLAAAQEAEKGAASNLEGAGLRAERAHKMAKDAKKQYGKESLEYREALYQEKTANEDLVKAREALSKAESDTASANAEKKKRDAAAKWMKDLKLQAEAEKKILDNRNARTTQNGFIWNLDGEKGKGAEAGKAAAAGAAAGFKTHNPAPIGIKKVTQFSDGIRSATGEAAAAGSGIGQSAVTGASGHSLHGVGVNLGAGLASGIKSQQSSVAETTRQLIVNGVRGTAVKYGRIKSPSRMMADIGKFLGMGLTKGLASTAKAVEQAALLLMAKVTNAFAIVAPSTFAESYIEAVNKAKEQQDKLADLNKSMPKKPSGKMSAKDKKAYEKELKAWQKQVAAAAQSMTDSYTKAGTNLARAFAVGLNDGIKSAKDGDASAMLSTLDGIIDFTNGSLRSQLQGYRGSLESVANTISGLNDKLTAQKDAMKSYVESMTEAFSGYSKDAFAEQGVDAQDYVASLKERLAASQDFAARMKQLEGLGLNQAAIDAIAGQGIEQGASIASSLLNGADKATIDEMNALYFKTEEIGKNLGTTLANTFYQPGIDALTGQIDSAKAAADSIGASIAASLKTQLDAAGGWGKLMVDNLASGIKAQSAVAVAAATDLAAQIQRAATAELPVFGYNAAGVASASAVPAPIASNSTTTNNNTINVTIAAQDTKDISTIDEFFARLKRAEGVYA